MKKLFNRKRIELTEVHTIETSWGYHYSLYKDSTGEYFVDESDGSDTVVSFPGCRTDEDTIEEFKQYMRELEEV